MSYSNYSVIQNSSVSLGLGKRNETFLKHPARFPLSENELLPRPLSLEVRTLFMVSYILIIVLSFFGNSIVIFVLAKARKRLTVTDMYMVSLALADLMISLLNMPFQLHFFLVNEWEMGTFVCKFSNYIQGVTVTASILTLTTIAVDRYFVICRPKLSRTFRTKKGAFIAILTAWVMALLIVCPQLHAQKVDMVIEVDYSTMNPLRSAFLCREHFDDPETVTIVMYVLVYVLPLTIMGFSYGAIGHRLWIQHPIGDMLENPRNHDRSIRQKKKIIKMLMFLVLAFAILWLPFFTAQLVAEFVKTDHTFRTHQAVLQLIGYSNCCINPIIYAFLNKTFQREFKAIFARSQVPLLVNPRSEHKSNSGNTARTTDVREDNVREIRTVSQSVK